MATIVGVQSHRLSPDGSSVAIDFAGREGSVASLTFQADLLDGLIAALKNAKEDAEAKRSRTHQGMRFAVPKTWAVGAHPLRDLVLLVFDARTEMERGFSLVPSDARDIARRFEEKAALIEHRLATEKKQ